MSRTMARRNSNTSNAATPLQASSSTAEQVSKITNVSFRLMGRVCSQFMSFALLGRFRLDDFSQAEQLGTYLQSFAPSGGGIDFEPDFVPFEEKVDHAAATGEALELAYG